VKGLGGSEGTRFNSPFALAAEGSWLPACTLHSIPDNGLRAVEVRGHKLVLFRRGSAVTCYQNACAHLGSALDTGVLDSGVLTCPQHGFRYDLKTGECLTAPDVRLQAHALRVIGERVEVRVAT
jgi:nitrite reductase/ring-hydroxylating ferredoxin subunit